MPVAIPDGMNRITRKKMLDTYDRIVAEYKMEHYNPKIDRQYEASLLKGKQFQRLCRTMKGMQYMITDFRCKYILPVASQSEIVNVISTRTDQAHVIMDNVIMTRTIYQLPNLSDSSNKNQHQWLRVRVGDIDCENNSKCTITYKKKTGKNNPEEAKLEVDDFYEANHMFELLGFQKTSTQETRRTKYVCFYEDIKYVICFDVWPGLEDTLFLTIEPGTNAEQADVESFIDLLGIETTKIERNKVDVDTEYLKRFSIPASLIDNLRFDFFDMKPSDLNEKTKTL